MNFSPAERAKIIEGAQRLVAERALEEIDLDEFQVLPVAVAARMAGLTVTNAKRVFPLVRLGQRYLGVRLSDYRATVEAGRQTSP